MRPLKSLLITRNVSGGYYAIFILALLGVLTGCENDIEKINLITGKEVLPVESSNDLEILYSDSARVTVKVIAGQMNRYDTGHAVTVLPMGINVEFFDSEGGVISTLDAQYAIRYEADILWKQEIVLLWLI